MSRWTQVCLAASVVILLTATLTPLSQAQVKLNQNGKAKLESIVDQDSQRRLQTKRTKLQFDQDGRRLANDVLDSGGKKIASERFRYDRRGRLIGREYSLSAGKLKWKWTKLQHNDAGEPTKNEIVNARGKRIGAYVWRYDNAGRLKRRDRLNADGSLRFYYANIKFNEQGAFSEWTKYDAAGQKIGRKLWRYANP